MADTSFENTPFGSLTTVESGQRFQYLSRLGKLPTSLKDIVFNLTTGAFLRGLTKQHNVSLDQVSPLAFVVLRVILGDVELAKLGAVLSAELKLPNDKAQAVAKEIEKELFAPVMLELNQFLEQQKKAASAGASASQAGTQNIIDLKHKSQSTEPKQNTKPKAQTTGQSLPKPGEFTR